MEMDLSGVNIPKHYKYHSDIRYNSIEIVRDKLRKNTIDHPNFDHHLESNNGIKYHYGVYQPNVETY